VPPFRRARLLDLEERVEALPAGRFLTSTYVTLPVESGIPAASLASLKSALSGRLEPEP
jgi:hypothetical protein